MLYESESHDGEGPSEAHWVEYQNTAVGKPPLYPMSLLQNSHMTERYRSESVFGHIRWDLSSKIRINAGGYLSIPMSVS